MAVFQFLPPGPICPGPLGALFLASVPSVTQLPVPSFWGLRGRAMEEAVEARRARPWGVVKRSLGRPRSQEVRDHLLSPTFQEKLAMPTPSTKGYDPPLGPLGFSGTWNGSTPGTLVVSHTAHDRKSGRSTVQSPAATTAAAPTAPGRTPVRRAQATQKLPCAVPSMRWHPPVEMGSQEVVGRICILI